MEISVPLKIDNEEWAIENFKWITSYIPKLIYVRYAYDIIIHCTSKEETGEVLKAIKTRLAERLLLKLLLNNTSRMTGVCHVWCCERLRGEIPIYLLGGVKHNISDWVKYFLILIWKKLPEIYALPKFYTWKIQKILLYLSQFEK